MGAFNSEVMPGGSLLGGRFGLSFRYCLGIVSGIACYSLVQFRNQSVACASVLQAIASNIKQQVTQETEGKSHKATSRKQKEKATSRKHPKGEQKSERDKQNAKKKETSWKQNTESSWQKSQEEAESSAKRRTHEPESQKHEAVRRNGRQQAAEAIKT